VTLRLKSIVSCWFILQILLPFTAPLQTLDLRDLRGTRSHHSTPSSPESTTTPTITEASAAPAVVAMQAPTTLHAAANEVVARRVAMRGPLALAFLLSSSPQVQQSVLRL
jgi:hypothetical protein